MSIKITTLILILVILGLTLLNSETFLPLQEPELIGTLPEITVTAPRYDIRGEMYPGMLEEVVVTAKRPSASIASLKQVPINAHNSRYFVLPLMFLLVLVSILYISLHMMVFAKEKNHAGSRY